jgi:hypothetical protein
LREELADCKRSNDIIRNQRPSEIFEQRLADAERRNAELEKVLSPFANYAANAGWLPTFSVRTSKGLFDITSDDWQACAALKPTESGASDHDQ